jgi:hypothetical protein
MKGRKPTIPIPQLLTLLSRYKSGETLRSLAKESNVSPASLSKRFQAADNPMVRQLSEELEKTKRGRTDSDNRNGAVRYVREGDVLREVEVFMWK